MKKPIGSIKIPGDVDVWPREYRTAVALSRAGFNVTFIKKSDENREKTPDLLIDGQHWEMKAPKTSNARAIDRNLRRALRQSRPLNRHFKTELPNEHDEQIRIFSSAKEVL